MDVLEEEEQEITELTAEVTVYVKRKRVVRYIPSWIESDEVIERIPINSAFVDNGVYLELMERDENGMWFPIRDVSLWLKRYGHVNYAKKGLYRLDYSIQLPPDELTDDLDIIETGENNTIPVVAQRLSQRIPLLAVWSETTPDPDFPHVTGTFVELPVERDEEVYNKTHRTVLKRKTKSPLGEYYPNIISRWVEVYEPDWVGRLTPWYHDVMPAVEHTLDKYRDLSWELNYRIDYTRLGLENRMISCERYVSTWQLPSGFVVAVDVEDFLIVDNYSFKQGQQVFIFDETKTADADLESRVFVVFEEDTSFDQWMEYGRELTNGKHGYKEDDMVTFCGDVYRCRETYYINQKTLSKSQTIFPNAKTPFWTLSSRIRLAQYNYHNGKRIISFDFKEDVSNLLNNRVMERAPIVDSQGFIMSFDWRMIPTVLFARLQVTRPVVESGEPVIDFNEYPEISWTVNGAVSASLLVVIRDRYGVTLSENDHGLSDLALDFVGTKTLQPTGPRGFKDGDTISIHLQATDFNGVKASSSKTINVFIRPVVTFVWNTDGEEQRFPISIGNRLSFSAVAYAELQSVYKEVAFRLNIGYEEIDRIFEPKVVWGCHNFERNAWELLDLIVKTQNTTEFQATQDKIKYTLTYRSNELFRGTVVQGEIESPLGYYGVVYFDEDANELIHKEQAIPGLELERAIQVEFKLPDEVTSAKGFIVLLDKLNLKPQYVNGALTLKPVVGVEIDQIDKGIEQVTMVDKNVGGLPVEAAFEEYTYKIDDKEYKGVIHKSAQMFGDEGQTVKFSFASREPEERVEECGEEFEFNTVSFSGYEFDHWEVKENGEEVVLNPADGKGKTLTITLDANAEIIAHFKEE